MFWLEKLGADGSAQSKSRVEQNDVILEEEGFYDCEISADGEFYLVTNAGTLIVWDAEGKEKAVAEDIWGGEEPVMREMGLACGGKEVYAYVCEGLAASLKAVTGGVKGAGFMIEIPAATGAATPFTDTKEKVKVFSGYENGILLAGVDKLWNYDIEKGRMEELFSWNDAYVNVRPSTVKQAGTGDGSSYLVCYDRTEEKYSFVEIERKGAEEVSDKTVIALGAINDAVTWDDLMPMVQRYNEQSEEYTVLVQTYGEEEDSYSEDVNRLNLALVRGEGPDLFKLSRLVLGAFADKNILADLYPFMEKSEGVRREDLVEGALKALESDGRLYAITPCMTMVGLVSVDGYAEDGGLSCEDMLRMVREYPDSVPIVGQFPALILEYALSADMDRFVNRSEKICSFDSREFEDLLSELATWKEDTAGFQPQSAPLLFEKEYLMDTVGFSRMEDYLEAKYAFSEFAQFSGYPNEQGEPVYRLTALRLFGIAESSEKKEGAWDFIEYILSEEYQKEQESFSVRSKLFEQALSAPLKVTEVKGAYLNRYSGEVMTQDMIPSEEDKEMLRRMTDHLIYVPSTTEDPIMSIIKEETAPVFAGSKTAGEAAEIIQNRVELFLNE